MSAAASAVDATVVADAAVAWAALLNTETVSPGAAASARKRCCLERRLVFRMLRVAFEVRESRQARRASAERRARFISPVSSAQQANAKAVLAPQPCFLFIRYGIWA